MKAKILTTTAIVCSSLMAQATTYYWTASVNSLYTEAGNWYLDADGQTPADYCPEFAIY